MVKKKLLLIVATSLFLFLISQSVFANTGNGKQLGVGLELGNPSALTAKLFLGKSFALQLAVGSGSWWWHSAFISTLDFVWHSDILATGSALGLNLYMGIGPGVGFFWYNDKWKDKYPDDKGVDPVLWVRVPFGMSLWFKKVPIEAFVELAPALRAIPAFDFDFFFVIGGRWYF